MSKFKGIENAKVIDRLPRFNEANANYLLEVEAVKVIKSRNKGDMFVVEAKVLEATGTGANQAGTSVGHIVPMSIDMALPNIKQFAAALLNEPTDNITASDLDDLTAAENPAKGYRVRAETFKTTKKDGSPFTAVRYTGTGVATTNTDVKKTKAA